MSSAPLAKQLVLGNRPLVIAHRGSSREAPENTLPAFTAAVGLGVDGVELDYQHTSDGVPVVFHDDLLDRTTDALARGVPKETPLVQQTLGQLRGLDAGRWFDHKFSNTRIPTLGEALNVIQTGAIPIIERKTGDASTLVDILRTKQLVDRVVVMAFDWTFLRSLRRMAPRLAMVALGEKNLSPAALDEAVQLGVIGIGWGNDSTDAGLIDRVHARKLKVWVWTVDDPERMQALLAAGVDALISNVPKFALEARAKREG